MADSSRRQPDSVAAESRRRDSDDVGPWNGATPDTTEPLAGATKQTSDNGEIIRNDNGGDESDWDREWDESSVADSDDEDKAILEQDPEAMGVWAGQASIKGSTETMRMVLLCLNHVGMTFTWGVEMTYCTPYLLSLGLTKGQTSLVWIAGPLSGLIVQPIVGAISDTTKSKWGRRRPYILSCSLIVALGLLLLGFTREIVGVFLDQETDFGRTITIILAVLALYATDFAINAVMSCSRSLIVDILPIRKQQAGAAWATRLGSIGHILGYGAGAIDLVGLLGSSFGNTQFKKLAVISAASIFLTSLITCWAVTERVLLAPDRRDDNRRTGAPVRFKVVRRIWAALLTLPPRMQAICWVVFWSWIGWYPFLIYSSTWVGEIYFRYDVPDDARDSKDAVGDMGRVGSQALTVYSIVTFLGAWILPLFVKSPDDDEEGFTARPPAAVAKFLAKINGVKPSLLTVWIYAHLGFAAAMFLAPFAASFRFATALVAISGIPWTIIIWAPTALLGVEVNKLAGASEDGRDASYRRLSVGSAGTEMSAMDPDSGILEDPERQRRTAHSSGELSGIYFGILNIYTTLPQFVGTFISAVVFAILDPGKSPELTDPDDGTSVPPSGPNAIAVCLFIGAISTLGAAYATRRLKSL